MGERERGLSEKGTSFNYTVREEKEGEEIQDVNVYIQEKESCATDEWLSSLESLLLFGLIMRTREEKVMFCLCVCLLMLCLMMRVVGDFKADIHTESRG